MVSRPYLMHILRARRQFEILLVWFACERAPNLKLNRWKISHPAKLILHTITRHISKGEFYAETKLRQRGTIFHNSPVCCRYTYPGRSPNRLASHFQTYNEVTSRKKALRDGSTTFINRAANKNRPNRAPSSIYRVIWGKIEADLLPRKLKLPQIYHKNFPQDVQYEQSENYSLIDIEMVLIG